MTKDITELFLEATNDNMDFKEAIDIVKNNTTGGCWLIGGFVYRNIANSLYNTPKPKVDLDFIVEKPLEEIKILNSWIISKNSYGNPKLIKDTGLSIDFVPLSNVHSILRRGIMPTIENFLTGTPLNIQSICYDIINNKVIGEIGIKAIIEKTVSVNDIEQAKIYSEKKHKSINQIIGEKATDLNFEPIYINYKF